MKQTRALVISGFIATAVSFGPARVGFGLYLPQFSAGFGISKDTAGLIAGSAFGAFLAGLPLTALLAVRYGPRLPIALGAIFACAGFALVATATGLTALAAGVIIAAISAALCWAPFNDAVGWTVPEGERTHALSGIATGTAIGVVLAASLSVAVAQGFIGWRGAWWLFALAAAICLVATMVSVPKRPERHRSQAFRPSDFWCREAMWLYGLALVFGATNAVFISFTSERVVDTGGLPGIPQDTASAILFLSYGAFGLVGLMTGRAEARFGVPILLRAIFSAVAASMVLIAVAPSSLPAVLLASGIHGAALMAISAVISFWSLWLFPQRGTIGFTVALMAMGIGGLVGPIAAGYAMKAWGGAPMFLLFAIPASLICLWPRPLPSPQGA